MSVIFHDMNCIIIVILLLSLRYHSLQCCLSIIGKNYHESILIIALPHDQGTEVSASWERGEEILSGALTAIEEAENGSLLFNLTLIVANSGPVAGFDLPYSGNVLEIIADLTWHKRVSNIIGIAGVLHPSVLAILNKFQLPTASLIHFGEAPHNSNVHYMIASTSMLTDAILAFFKQMILSLHLNNLRFGLVTEIKQLYFLTLSNELSTKANISFNIQINNRHRKSLAGVAHRVVESNIHVIVLSVGPTTAIPMLCEAYKRGLIWPKYAWILHSYRLDDLLRSSASNEGCCVQKMLERVFIFQLTEERSSHRNMGNGTGGFNPYANLLYDSVSALISSVDSGLFNEESLPPHFNPQGSKVYIYQSINETANLAGIYDGTSRTLTNVSAITFTDSNLPIVYEQALLVPYLLPLSILSFLLNTILMVLYIIFRNKSDIKSTSVSLSMLIFIGCYLLVGFNFALLFYLQFRLDTCMLQVWLSGIGLPLPLILATILVKMLRVYRIFTKFKVLNQSIKYKDYALLVYTMLIISPNIIVHVLWTVIDPHRKADYFIEHPGFIRMEIRCSIGQYYYIWFALAYGYLSLLFVIVVIVAVKSRKIRRANFKDTKKVNLFISLLFITATCSFSYWQILQYSGFHHSAIVLYFGHILGAFLCQAILFMPKIWPLIKKKITKVCPNPSENNNIII